jgi:hypothetical protein
MWKSLQWFSCGSSSDYAWYDSAQSSPCVLQRYIAQPSEWKALLHPDRVCHLKVAAAAEMARHSSPVLYEHRWEVNMISYKLSLRHVALPGGHRCWKHAAGLQCWIPRSRRRMRKEKKEHEQLATGMLKEMSKRRWHCCWVVQTTGAEKRGNVSWCSCVCSRKVGKMGREVAPMQKHWGELTGRHCCGRNPREEFRLELWAQQKRSSLHGAWRGHCSWVPTKMKGGTWLLGVNPFDVFGESV